MSYDARLSKLEAALVPERAPRVCVIWDVWEPDAAAAVARWREANDWPDDGRHPIALLHIRWNVVAPSHS